MKYAVDVVAYHAAQKDEHATICEALMKLFSKTVAEADAKVWHGHPVWFIDGNPVFGYSIKKSRRLRLMLQKSTPHSKASCNCG